MPGAFIRPGVFTRPLCQLFLSDHCVRCFYQTIVSDVFIRLLCQLFLSDHCGRCFYQTTVSAVFIRPLWQVLLSDYCVRCFYQTTVAGALSDYCVRCFYQTTVAGVFIRPLWQVFLSDHCVGYLHQIETEPILTERNKTTGRLSSDISVLHCRRFLCRINEHFSQRVTSEDYKTNMARKWEQRGQSLC